MHDLRRYWQPKRRRGRPPLGARGWGDGVPSLAHRRYGSARRGRHLTSSYTTAPSHTRAMGLTTARASSNPRNDERGQSQRGDKRPTAAAARPLNTSTPSETAPRERPSRLARRRRTPRRPASCPSLSTAKEAQDGEGRTPRQQALVHPQRGPRRGRPQAMSPAAVRETLLARRVMATELRCAMRRANLSRSRGQLAPKGMHLKAPRLL